MNNSDPAIALPGDQCVLAQNVEWVVSMLGERRLGSLAITLAPPVDTLGQIVFLHRHLPTSDESIAELYALGFTVSASTLVLGRKTTVWGNVAMPDVPNVGGVYPFQWDAVTLHGKTFFAYKSPVDRLHLVEGIGATTMRRAGLAAPTAGPTVSNTGTAGSYAGTRFFRTRLTIQVGGATTLRSEPSAVTQFVPPSAFNGAIVARQGDTGEGATHWEVEASTGNVNFYRIATLSIATPTHTDTTNYVTDYSAHPLSEDLEDYALLPSARYLTFDEDRLIWGGSYENEAMQSRVGWTPVRQATGVGNDERMETDTDPTIDLDGYRGGPLTGLTSPVLGSVIAFKFQMIYKLLRTGERTRAYQALLLTDARGALHGSAVEGVDEQGRPCVYFLDPFAGPSVFGVGGIRSCGGDLFETWRTCNLNAPAIVCRGLYYPAKKQVHWWIATGASSVPDTHLVLHVQHARQVEDGVRKGWAIWTGLADARCACLFADNIDTGGPRNRSLVPFIGGAVAAGAPLIRRCDIGNTDSGTPYVARIVDHPRTASNILDNTGIQTGALLAKAAAGAAVDIKIQRDFGLETEVVANVSLTPTAAEPTVIRRLDNLEISECAVFQVEFADAAGNSTPWALNQFVLRGTTEQRT